MNYGDYKEFKITRSLGIRSLFTFSLREFQSGYIYKGEMHDFYEAVIIMKGKAVITAGKNVYSLSGGEMILHPPRQFHNISNESGEDVSVLVFSFRARSFPEIEDGPIFKLSQKESDTLRGIYSDSLSVFVRDGVNISLAEGRQLDAEAIILRLELFLLSVISEKNKREKPKRGKSSENYRNILSVMEKNLSADLSAEELARLSQMSVSSLEKTVRRYSGYGARAYYNIMRMQRATELLLSGESVKGAALAGGFSDQNYFSARYKKWCGGSPSKVKS